MQLLTAYDEVVNIHVPDGNLEKNENLHTLDADTDSVIRGIANEYYKGNKNAHLRRMKNDNGYLIYEDTGIKYGDRPQSQGVFVQFNYACGDVCNLLFFSVDTYFPVISKS